jgi:putative hemolysin
VNRKSEPTCPGTANIRAPADIDTTDDNRGGAVTMDSVWIEVVLVVFAIIVNGFFSGSEIALVSARVARLVELRRRGTRGAATALALKDSPESFLATIQIAITLVGALASAVGGAAAIERLTPALAALPLPASTAWAQPVALGLVILTITYLSLVVGELTPKAIALRAPEQVSCLVAPVIAGLNRAGGWLVAVLTASTNVLLRILGQGRVQQSPFISEEEVRYLVREGAAKGVFGKVEEELVHNAFEFGDTTVREIMVPRMNIVGLDVETSPDGLLSRIAEIAHSRIPVYRDSIENVLGVVTVRDVFRVVARGEPVVLPALLRPPQFIPEGGRISNALREFQRSRQYLAFVVDEYGGLVGLVTLEDVLEEIVGEIREEGETVPSFVTRLANGSFIVDGTAPIREVRQRLGIRLPNSPDYTTAAGFVMHVLGEVPQAGASMAHSGHRWTVLGVEGTRVTRIKVEPLPGAGTAAD